MNIFNNFIKSWESRVLSFGEQDWGSLYGFMMIIWTAKCSYVEVRYHLARNEGQLLSWIGSHHFSYYF